MTEAYAFHIDFHMPRLELPPSCHNSRLPPSNRFEYSYKEYSYVFLSSVYSFISRCSFFCSYLKASLTPSYTCIFFILHIHLSVIYLSRSLICFIKLFHTLTTILPRNFNIVTWRLKAGIVEPGRKSISSRRLAKRIWPLLGNGSVSTFRVNEDSTMVSMDTEKHQQFPWVRARLYKEPCREERFREIPCGGGGRIPLP
jgi:hypothetical protein